MIVIIINNILIVIVINIKTLFLMFFVINIV